MTEENNPSPQPAEQPVAARQPELHEQVDELLDEVEALTNEVLADTEQAKAKDGQAAQSKVPERDPAKEVIADDVGLSAESPLIQDGEKTAVQEVVAEVDHELHQMEKLINGMVDPVAGEDPALIDEMPVIPESPNHLAAEESQVDSENVDHLEAKTSPGPGAESSDRLDAEGTAGLEDQSSKRLDDEIAAEIPTVPKEAASALSQKEQVLDDDLEALLGTQPAPEVEAPADDIPLVDDSAPAAESAQEDASAKKEQALQREAASEIDLESIPVWRLIKLRLAAKSKKALWLVGRKFAGGLVWVLQKIDARLGDRVPPMVRELIGYCALGTLAMCLIAVLLALL